MSSAVGFGRPEMVSELLHRLQTELDSAEADLCVSLLDGWVELPQRRHRLSIGLYIEDNRHSEACRVVVGVGLACGVKNADQDDLTINSPRRRIGDDRVTAPGFSDVGVDAVWSDVRRRCASSRSRRCSHAARVCSAHVAISTSGSGRSRHGRRCPSRLRVIRPACSRTFRCLEMAGRLIGNGSANSSTVASPSANRRTIERRVGSDKAAKTTSNRSGAVPVIAAVAPADTS